MKLNQDSVGQFFKDQAGNLYECLKEYRTCCSPLLYYMKEDNGPNTWAYNAWGERIDFQGTPVQDKSTTLKLGE